MRRWLRRLLVASSALVAVLVISVGVLLGVTPSVRSAWSIARRQAGSHGAAFPGPPVPHRFSAALIATEDHRFRSEPGIDFFAIARVLYSRVTGHGDQGGATLYQQLAKLLYTPSQSGIRVETEQVALGVKLKYRYSGEQILRMYEDIAYFGHGYYGLSQASCGYFGRRPGELSWPQAALLAGLVQAPSAYDPLAHPVLARAREQHVFARLVATGMLTARRAAAGRAVSIARLTSHAGGCLAG